MNGNCQRLERTTGKIAYTTKFLDWRNTRYQMYSAWDGHDETGPANSQHVPYYIRIIMYERKKSIISNNHLKKHVETKLLF